MKIRYLPGDYPVPMLAVGTKPNEEEYKAIVHEPDFLIRSEDLFTKEHKHFYNMNAYIIFDEKELKVVSYRMTSFAHFVYLLRTISKPLMFEITDDEYFLIKNDLENFFSHEFEVYQPE